MADEFKLRGQQKRGIEAEALLKNTLLESAFTSLNDELMSAWENSDPNDTARREDAWRSLKLLGKLKKGLERHVRTGQTAGKELLQFQSTTKKENVNV